ncbi:hypothetical protein FRB96_002798 [Tulasnella sp. 330]|nr:hypothetical protein FRB96_002798 [Tulasnella sp. 330]KAG8877960.1 hypothetical protein FRB97_002885 [Tulasnella sp. 331]
MSIPKHNFIVWCPDYDDAEAVSRRFAVRDQHFANATPLVKSGVVTLGGALLSPDSFAGGPTKMVGSLMIFKAETIEEVREKVENDVYYTGKVSILVCTYGVSVVIMVYVPALSTPVVVEPNPGLRSSSALVLSQSYRAMSSTKHTFVVWAPDFDDAEGFSRRLAVREEHLAVAAKEIATGSLKIGGVCLTPESITGGDKKMIGSMMLFEAESLEEVRARIESDIYYKKNVWDPKKLAIFPFVAAGPPK